MATMYKRRKVYPPSSSTPISSDHLRLPRQMTQSNTTSSLPTSYNITQLNYGISDGQIVYSVPITMGGDDDGLTGVPLRVQLDTGSADVWLASRSCDTDSCTKSSSGNAVVRYDAAGQGAKDINQDWTIQYIAGSASGSIFTQDLLVGGNIRVIDQAFGSANQVDGEDLKDMNVTGVMGLALPAASTLQQVLAPGAGQAFVRNFETGSVLTGLWSGTQRSPMTPRIFSVGLQRLPSDGGGRTANSTLALGGVDRAYVPTAQDPKVRFSSNLPDSDGLHRHWKLYLSDITTNGVDGVVHIPASYAGQSDVYPTVVLDTGAPLNYAPSSILNAMYGAFEDARGYRLGPGENGIYYVPCDKPLNISLTVGDTSIPIHPLDASLSEDIEGGSGSGSSVSGCIGSFQSLRAGSPAGADIVLGAPFLRSAYSIYSCDAIPANSNGREIFSRPVTGPCLNPAVALYPTTQDTGAALQEFNEVRVNGQSLGSNSAAGISESTKSDGGLSTGAKIAIGIVAALVGLVGAFGLLVWYARRRALKMRRLAAEARDGDMGAGAIALEEKTRSYDGKGDGMTGAAFDRKQSRSRSRTTSGGGPFSDGRARDHHDGYADLFGDDDDEVFGEEADGRRKTAMMSAKEQARLREAAILHGYYDEDLMGDDNTPHPAAAAVQTPFAGATHLGVDTAAGKESNASWDVSSSGYVDARRVRREYLKRHPSLELQRQQGQNEGEAAGGSNEEAALAQQSRHGGNGDSEDLTANEHHAGLSSPQAPGQAL